MTTETTDFRLDGIYRQRQEGFFMQRVKLPAGVISSRQARTVSQAAERFGRGAIHLTTRGSMEIHWLRQPDLPALKTMLATVGLTSRGACGGAVRGITCGTSQTSAEFPRIDVLARRLQRHFTGNPRFERLPKKFKIGIEATTMGNRHLIQDVGLVLADTGACGNRYDVYVAGGLGREPQPGFLLAPAVAEERIIPLIEAILRVYADGTPQGKRLKHLARSIGQDELARRVSADPGAAEELPPFTGIPETLFPSQGPLRHITAHIRAGNLTSGELAGLADFADARAEGVLTVTAAQDILFHISPAQEAAEAHRALEQLGFSASGDRQVAFRVCPGNHECRAGIAPTRDIADIIEAAMGPAARKLTWAISGCHNSCTQPQLADWGIVSSRLAPAADGERTPLFDLYRSSPGGLGERLATSLSLDELAVAVQGIV